CRSAGFFGNRGSIEGNPAGFNYTQAVIDAAGGCLEVCGQKICGTDSSSPSAGIENIGSALEALCPAKNDTGQLNQTFRQMVSAALNCVLTGAGTAQCGTLLNPILVGVTWEQCNAN